MSGRKVKEMRRGCPLLKDAEMKEILEEIKDTLVHIRAQYNAHKHASSDAVPDELVGAIEVDLGE